MTPLDTARDYLRLGLAIVPVPAGLKHPILENWHLCQFDIADLDCKGNLAFRLGRCSGNLVDIDLDCREALALADLYLPPTGAEFGRASKPRSHRLYISAGATFEVFHDRLTDKKNTLLELRADGRDGGAHVSYRGPPLARRLRRGGRAMSAFDLDRFVRVIATVGSAHDGEAPAAARLAERLLRDGGLTWATS